MSHKELKKKRILTFFIEAAQDIMTKEGIEAITLRRVADLAGYNAATLYNYFEDLDQLILFASLKHLKMYNLEVVEQIKKCKSEREKFITMWKTFCRISFQYPQPFYQIFFNKHSDSLEAISKQYYDLFPEDLGTHDKNLKEILSGTKLAVRNEAYLKLIANEESQSWIKISLMNEMMVALYQNLLLKRISESTNTKQNDYENRMIEYVDFILDHAE